MRKKVLVAMSGGVDSSVSALLLKKEGFDVAGITMYIEIKDKTSTKPLFCGKKSVENAKNICKKIAIEHYTVDFSDIFHKKVVDNFISEYSNARTPNPCVVCNRFIKFNALYKKAISLGFDYLATGHYAKIDNKNEIYFMRKPKDKAKDQTYFLYAIDRNLLKNIIFPLNSLTKNEIWDIARENNLFSEKKSQSQDICFIPDGNYTEFITKKTGFNCEKEGTIFDLNGKALGKHKGIMFYTRGQRGGLGISHKEPLYVIDIDPLRNAIIVGEKKHLGSRSLLADNLNLFFDKFPDKLYAKIRYNHKEAPCKVRFQNNKAEVIFDEKQSAITPGQSVVFFFDDVVYGGGIIRKSFITEDKKEASIETSGKNK